MFTKHRELPQGELCFILGYLRIVPEEILSRHKHNLVVHESALPQGRGCSPMGWQILDDERSIVFTLFEAEAGVDSGAIYLQQTLNLDGTELYPEWRAKQAALTAELVAAFLDRYPEIQGRAQTGEPSTFRKRGAEDDELDPNLPLGQLFDQLRICDPDQYPAWFSFRGRRYKLRIDPWE